MSGRFVLVCCVPFLFAASVAAAAASGGTASQLQKLRDYVAEISVQVEGLQAALRKAETRNREQSALIGRLESQLRQYQANTAQGQARVRAAFFGRLAQQLPLSPVYQVKDDRIIIPADPVFVFSRASLGAEGELRLRALAAALREAIDTLPADQGWRLRIEGHTDPRPLKGNRAFASNWELSAARATAMLRYLVRQGLPEDRLEAVALAATAPLSRGRTRSDHRRNRRIEIHLEP